MSIACDVGMCIACDLAMSIACDVNAVYMKAALSSGLKAESHVLTIRSFSSQKFWHHSQFPTHQLHSHGTLSGTELSRLNYQIS